VVELRRTITDIEKKSREMAAHKQADQAGAARLKKMVSAEDVPVLLQKISNLAKEHAIKVVQINHSTEAGAGQSTKGKAGQQPASKNASVNIRLELLGTYHDIGALLWAFEEASEPLVIDDLKIGREAGEVDRQRASLTLKTFIGE
jgi:hypothetical protein